VKTLTFIAFVGLVISGPCTVEETPDLTPCYEDFAAFMECSDIYADSPYMDDLIDGSGALRDEQDYGE